VCNSFSYSFAVAAVEQREGKGEELGVTYTLRWT